MSGHNTLHAHVTEAPWPRKHPPSMEARAPPASLGSICSICRIRLPWIGGICRTRLPSKHLPHPPPWPWEVSARCASLGSIRSICPIRLPCKHLPHPPPCEVSAPCASLGSIRSTCPTRLPSVCPTRCTKAPTLHACHGQGAVGAPRLTPRAAAGAQRRRHAARVRNRRAMRVDEHQRQRAWPGHGEARLFQRLAAAAPRSRSGGCTADGDQESKRGCGRGCHDLGGQSAARAASRRCDAAAAHAPRRGPVAPACQQLVNQKNQSITMISANKPARRLQQQQQRQALHSAQRC